MLSRAKSDLRGGFYVPAASIAVGTPGEYLLESYGIAVTQVEVDRQLSMAGTFKFTVPNCYDQERRDFRSIRGKNVLDILKRGTRVWIYMGYGDKVDQKLLMSGSIVSISTSFAEGGSPELEISGQDALFAFGLGTNEHQVKEGGVAAAIRKVTSRYGIRTTIDGEPPKPENLECNWESDLEFLRKLVENYAKKDVKWEFFIRPDVLMDEIVFKERDKKRIPIGLLYWGEDLLNFKPDVNLGGQVDAVYVHSHDQVNNKQILGKAQVERLAPGGKAGEVSASASLSEISSNPKIFQFRMPVKTQEEADNRAKEHLQKMSSTFLKGEGETFGWPELLPDRTIAIKGLCKTFDRTYYITKTTHRLDGSGYRTRFSTEDTHSC